MALQWETDRGLQLRMALALVLVLVLPVAFVYAFVFLMNTDGVELLSFATEREWRGRFYVEPWLIVGAVAVGETLVLGGSREVRGYWESQLRRG
jgi:heat shock protein HtpX